MFAQQVDNTELSVVAVDAGGNSLVAGTFLYEIPTEDVPLVGFRSVVTKLTSTGAVSWSRVLMSDEQNCHVSNIDVDAAGNVYVSGSFGGVVDFDPGAGTTTLDSDAGGT